MAELAIPAVALGALYICSNKNRRERGKKRTSQI